MNAVPVTVNGVLVRRNDSRLEDFIEAAEPVALIGEGAPQSPVPSSATSEPPKLHGAVQNQSLGIGTLILLLR